MLYALAELDRKRNLEQILHLVLCLHGIILVLSEESNTS